MVYLSTTAGTSICLARRTGLSGAPTRAPFGLPRREDRLADRLAAPRLAFPPVPSVAHDEDPERWDGLA